MAPQDSQNCGRDFAKRKQTDAEFAGNSLLGMVITDIAINVLLSRVTRHPAGMHCPLWDDAFVSSYRQDAAKRQTAGIVFTHSPKIRFFAPQGRLVAPIQVKLCSTDGDLGPLGCAKFHVNRCRRVGMRPQKYQKLPLFGKESPRRGDSLDRFPTFFRGFYTPNYATLVFQISCDSHHRLRSHCGETARR